MSNRACSPSSRLPPPRTRRSRSIPPLHSPGRRCIRAGSARQRRVEHDVPRAGARRWTRPTVDADARQLLIDYADGDGRHFLNSMEQLDARCARARSRITADFRQRLADASAPPLRQRRRAVLTSSARCTKRARQRSGRAALYWFLTRMLEGGADPRFTVGRRMIAMASEDIGLADRACAGYHAGSSCCIRATGFARANSHWPGLQYSSPSPPRTAVHRHQRPARQPPEAALAQTAAAPQRANRR